MVDVRFPVVIHVAVIALALCSCSNNNNTVDGDTDTGLDTDTTYDGGATTPCEGDPPAGGMVCVPGGRYLMGCMPYDTQCEDSEKPMAIVIHSIAYAESYQNMLEVQRVLSGCGLPVYHSLSNSARAIARFMDYHKHRAETLDMS